MTKLKWNSKAIPAEDLKNLKRLAKNYRSFSQFSIEVGIERMALTYIIKRKTATPENAGKIKDFLKTQLTAA